MFYLIIAPSNSVRLRVWLCPVIQYWVPFPSQPADRSASRWYEIHHIPSSWDFTSPNCLKKTIVVYIDWPLLWEQNNIAKNCINSRWGNKAFKSSFKYMNQFVELMKVQKIDSVEKVTKLALVDKKSRDFNFISSSTRMQSTTASRVLKRTFHWGFSRETSLSLQLMTFFKLQIHSAVIFFSPCTSNGINLAASFFTLHPTTFHRVNIEI